MALSSVIVLCSCNREGSAVGTLRPCRGEACCHATALGHRQTHHVGEPSQLRADRGCPVGPLLGSPLQRRGTQTNMGPTCPCADPDQRVLFCSAGALRRRPGYPSSWSPVRPCRRAGYEPRWSMTVFGVRRTCRQSRGRRLSARKRRMVRVEGSAHWQPPLKPIMVCRWAASPLMRRVRFHGRFAGKMC